MCFSFVCMMYSITSFQIRNAYGQTRSESIDDLFILADLLKEEGPNAIQKVSFYFTDTENPHVFHNQIIYRDSENDSFYLAKDNRSSEPREEDTGLILEALARCDALDSVFTNKIQF